MNTSTVRSVLLSSLLPVLLPAVQPGELDTTFKTGGGANGQVYSIARQKDGKLILGGDFTSVQQVRRSRVARLLANGQVDPTFNPGLGTDDLVYTVALQADGKILIGGDFDVFNGTLRKGFARLNADGSLDSNYLGRTDGSVRTIKVQPDGKVLVCGSFNKVNDITMPNLARLMPDGSLDTTFNPGGAGPDGTVHDAALQTDGKIVIGGSFNTYNGTARQYLARLNADGTLDSGFTTGTGPDSVVYAVQVQPNGRVLIGGEFASYNGTPRNHIARLNTDGMLDNTFDPGTGTTDAVAAIALQADGKVVVGGIFTHFDGVARACLARLKPNGSLDTSFTGGTEAFGRVEALVVEPTGKLVVGGFFRSCNGVGRSRVARFTTTGAVDLTFNTGSSGTISQVTSLALQADGKVLIGGGFTSYNGIRRNSIARLNADGTLDSSFDPGTGANQAVNALALQAGGKALIGGSFTTYNGTSINRMARLNQDGSLDTTFDPGTGASNSLYSMATQPDGKVIIGGNFTTYNEVGRNRIVRLHPDGSLDLAYATGSGANNAVTALTLQPDGKALIGGWFTSCHDVPLNRLARLDVDGSLDGSFNPGTGANNAIYAIALQPDNRVLIGGGFTSYNGTSRSYFTRLNADGSVDTTFDAGTGPDGPVNAIALQPDGKLLIGGSFSVYDGVGRHDIARLNADGSLDPSFDPGVGTNSSIMAMAMQPDGKLLVGGFFDLYDGKSADHVGRVHLTYGHSATTFTGITSTEDAADSVLLGKVRLTLTRTGSFTATLSTGTEVVAFTGFFDEEGRSLVVGRRKDRSVVYLSVALTRSDLGAALVEGSVSTVAGRSAELTAYAPYFSSSRLPANHFTGTYHAALRQTGSNGVFAGALPPSGFGFLTCNVSRSGGITVTGKASDGSVLTASANLNDEGVLHLHFQMYAGKGFINGVVAIDDSTFTPTRRPVTATLLWKRPAAPGAYPTGFEQFLEADGSQYLPQVTSLPTFGGTAVDSVEATIAGGNIFSSGIQSDLSFRPDGMAEVVPGGFINTLKLKINRSTGTFAGSFIPPAATKAVAIQGVIISRSKARGYSLVPGVGGTLPAGVSLDVP